MAALQPARSPAPDIALVTGEGAGGDIVPADPSTPYTLAIGDSVSGFVNTTNDHDWYRVSLVAGQSYRFTMDATSGGLDCFLEMRDANGNLLAIDDDSGAGTNSNMVFLCTVTGTYYVSAQAYTDATQSSSGGYTLTSSTAPTPNILDSIDWGTQVSNPTTILVYFANPGEVFDGVSSLGWNAYEKQQAMLALQQYANVANLTFAITTDPSQATFKLVTTTSSEYSAYFNPPGTFNAGVGVFARNASGWDENGGGGLEPGGRGFAVLLHEFGHALGMAHPHDNGGTSEIMQRVTSATGSYGLFDLNQGVYTVMTYNFGWQVGPNGVNIGLSTSLEASPMALDVALIQEKYGANTSYHTGNDTYVLGASPTFTCIWDAGGIDAIVYGGSSNCTIDLRAATIDYTATGGGLVSYIGLTSGFTIAQGVVIENASGGSGNDSIVGNSAANTLTGGAGNDTISGGGGDDTITGGPGADTIDGGDGQDTAVFGEVYANYQVTFGSSAVTVTHISDGEVDTLTHVETLSFADKQVPVVPSNNSPPTAPADSNAAANTVSEGALTGDVVAGLSLSSTDANVGDKITYSLTDDAGGRFAINATTGVVTVKDASLLNFETATSHQIKVQASDGTDVSTVSTFTISVTDVAPTAPTDANASSNTIAESVANGAVVAGLSIGASDIHGGTVTYALTDDAGGRFAINASTGVVTVKDASLLNYESATSHQIKVQASDGSAVSTVSTFTINVTDVAPSAPVDGDAAANTIAGDAANGAVVAGLSVSSTDVHGGTVTYGLANDAGGRFAINASTGVVTVKDASLLNTASSHQIQVWAFDGTAQSTASTFTINVTSSQPPPPSFSINNAGTVSEGGAAVFTVTMSGSISAPTTVWYSTVNGTATAAAGDFNAVTSQALTFNPGGPTSQQISIPILIEPNNPAESAESFSVGLQASQGGAVFTSGSTTIAANGSTGPPTFTISNAGAVTEGGAAVFNVTLSGSISTPTTVWYSTINGTASSTAGDFTAVTSQALTFNPGGPTTQQISIPILIEPNNPPESNEIFYVGLQATQTGKIFAHGSATIAANGGTTTGPTFTISNAGTVSEGGAAVFNVTLSGSISAPTTVWYSTINGTASSTAGDFAALTGQALTFNPGGPTTQQITVPILVEPGNPAEGAESFSVGLQATQSGAAYATGSATILANGTAPTFSISGPGTVSEGANALFTVTMTGAISAPTTVWYSTIDGTATAAAGDFNAVSSQAVTFNPGGPTTQQITVPILVEPGNPAESAESFSVGLQASQGGAVFTSSSATIAANGSTAGPTFSVSNVGTVSEGGAAIFTVTMSGSISAPTTVWYSTVDGTATAAAGDFNAVSSQAVTFNPGGPTTQQISIPILIEPNNPAESAESFSVGLQASQGGAVFTSGSATIAANGGTTNAPTFTINNAGTVTEGGAALFTVTMSGSISAPTTVWYSTINGTASSTAGDFTAVTSQALTFNPGGPTTQQITVPILIEPSNPPENNEIFYVGLKATQTGTYFAHGSATIAANGSSGASAALFMSNAEGLDAPSVDAAKAQDWAAALESLNLLDNSQHIAALAHAWSAGVAGEPTELAPHGATTLFEGAAPFVPALIALVSAASETPWSGEPEHVGPHAHLGDGFALQLGLQVHHGDWFG